MVGHFTPNPCWTNEVWGLAALNKDNERYITCSDDATLRVYSNLKRKCLGILELDVYDEGKYKGKKLKRVKYKGIKGKGSGTNQIQKPGRLQGVQNGLPSGFQGSLYSRALTFVHTVIYTCVLAEANDGGKTGA